MGNDTFEKMGKAIAKRRKELGMSQEELSFKLGYASRSTINKVELGKVGLNMKKIIKLSEILDCSVDYILGNEEENSDEQAYYFSAETARAAQEIFQSKELRALFSIARDAKPEDLKFVHNILLELKRRERGEHD